MQHAPLDFRRREFLRVGGLALGGLTLPQILAAQQSFEQSSVPPTAVDDQRSRVDNRSVILLYLHGGPSQLETYDLKPDAPIEYRSVFRPIATAVPGMDICEHFPRQAAIATRFSLIRSLHHDIGIHSDGGIIVLTGKRPAVLDPTSQSKSEHPDIGAIASRLVGSKPLSPPPYIAIPRSTYMTTPGYLGHEHAPYVAGDPSQPGWKPFSISVSDKSMERSLRDRRYLLREFDRFRVSESDTGQLQATDRFRERAWDMLTNPRLADAFDLSQENETTRNRYGRHLWGQGCLLARRLAEAGSSVISLYIDTPKSGPEFTNWDDHIANAGRPGHFADYMLRRLPYLDEALSALIDDIFDRGVDRQIMVVVVGEFGRTPRLSHNATGTGRDHWPQAYSALVSGGGLRMGQVIGETNSKAEHPTSSPYRPQDLLATMYHHLGININHTFIDRQGRPIPILYEGAPIKELV